MKSFLIGIALTAYSFSALAGSNFAVETGIFHNGTLVGSPSLVLSAGSEAGAAAEGKYKLTLKSSEAKNGEVLVQTTLEVGNEKLSPSLLVALGKEATVIMGEITFRILIKKA